MYTDWEYPVLPMVLSFEDYPPEISNRYPTYISILESRDTCSKKAHHLQGIKYFYSNNFGSVEFEKTWAALRETTSDTKKALTKGIFFLMKIRC